MESLKLFLAVIGIGVLLYLLVKRYDTRMSLMFVGLALSILTLHPMDAFAAFSKQMTSGGLIMAICSSLGFAYVMKFCKCDQHLVALLTKPLTGLGFALIPLTTIITFLISIAIPSAAGCSAAVGATLIPALRSAGVRAEMAAAAILSGTCAGGLINPGNSHTSMISKMTGLEPMVVNMGHMKYTFIIGLIVAVGMTIMAIVFKDYSSKFKEEYAKNKQEEAKEEGVNKVNILYAIAPLVPLLILIAGGLPAVFPDIKTDPSWSWLTYFSVKVPEAMLIGALYGLLITLKSPSKICQEFFKGMGDAYANVLGIIIAAGVFVAGLRATGAIDVAVAFLKNSNEFVRWGASFGPFIMGIVTGSGDAATIAFNESITPHAIELGYSQVNLGMGAALTGGIGRTASPIAGAAIICAGLAGVSSINIAKRTIVPMFASAVFVALFML